MDVTFFPASRAPSRNPSGFQVQKSTRDPQRAPLTPRHCQVLSRFSFSVLLAVTLHLSVHVFQFVPCPIS